MEKENYGKIKVKNLAVILLNINHQLKLFTLLRGNKI
jgi:hypothetical protein